MYSNLVITPRQWSRLACLCRSVSSIESQKLPQVSKSSDGISPPPRIPRGPTDILQALAATVGADPTAPHYKYHDDPFLIPLSNYRKRAYALSAEAGRKAAAWIRDEHANLFTTREWDPPMKMKTPYFNADPQIDIFAPKPIYNDESKVTEDDLKYTIQNALIEDSIKIFELLGGVEKLNDDLKLSLLQLLCFYNEKEPIAMEWLEERWFAGAAKERQGATWKLGGLADKLFLSMDPKTPEAYCSIIKGMAKFFQAERAHALAQEAKENGIPLSTSVYNTLLSCVGFLKEGASLRIEALKGLLVEMNEQGLTPNVKTLNACLKSISAWGSAKTLQTIALQIVSEFKLLGIEPNLTSYYYLLCLFCKEQGPRIDILSGILSDLERKESLVANEPMDTNFFITAMGVCSEHLRDMNLAERLHALLMKGDNYKLVGDAFKESIYYRHFVTVACRYAPFERTLELLDLLIPNIYVPEPSVMEEIIKTLEVGGDGDRLAACWSQLVVFGHARRTRLVERLLEAFCNCYECQEEEIKEKIRIAAADMLKFSQLTEEREETEERRSPTQKLSATALSNIAILCSDTPNTTSSAATTSESITSAATSDAAPSESVSRWQAVEEVVSRLRGATGAPDAGALALVVARAAKSGHHAIAASTIQYLAEYGFEEAISASVEALAIMLNRTTEEAQILLEGNKSSLAASLHPSALAVAQAYHLAKTGAPLRDSDSTSSSDSDSDSSDEN